MVFKGPGLPILMHFSSLFREPLAELAFARFLSILGTPGLPFRSLFGTLFATLFLKANVVPKWVFGGRWCLHNWASEQISAHYYRETTRMGVPHLFCVHEEVLCSYS